ncbi:VOC family protein [Isobaculum melis]|uniref:Glyoxalase superfamily enzyme, possibly 3-demethylubiquinone-9 3-methyltransferase n=1 Tax=Isobaculum melis TaxID=142588 RepID=A0A1H9QJG6_9LACT|nr:VOC family protein [Isobaculum melis]SER60580.1 Glyoxalase superfamily enzyme, possibly 3-demethylubiquinone-9 3-methyltransferase [Isobaculum melis]
MYQRKTSISTFLTFGGTADEAVTFYLSLFPNESHLLSKTTFKEGQPGIAGSILNLTFDIRGQSFMAMDMEEKYLTNFSWATSILVQCTDETEFDRLFQAFSKQGHVMMGPEAIMDLNKACWVTDRFGVTWQLIWSES